MLSWIVTSCVLILAVLLIRRAFRSKAPARAIYALWLFVALRLLIPGILTVDAPVPAVATVVNRAPVVQLSERLDGADSLELTPTGDVEVQYTSDAEPEIIAEQVTRPEFNLMSALLDVKKLLVPLWLAGAACVAAALLLSMLRFAHALRRDRVLLREDSSPVPVYVSGAVDTPCLFGLIRPAIYVTPEAAADANLLRHALAHEISHYRQLDHVWCAVRCVCLALHWYNPLVWLAAKLSRRDSELACDEATVKRLGENERAEYGRSLIRMTCENPHGAAVATTMSARPKELKERIKMLTKNRHSVIALSLAAILAVSATACSFVSSPAETTPVPGSDAGTITFRNGEESTFDFTAPGGAEVVRISAWVFDGRRWVEQPQTELACSAETGSISFNIDTYYDTYSYLLEFTGRNSVSASNKSLGTLAGGEDADFRSRHINGGPIECAVNETVPLVLVTTADDASLDYLENPLDIEDKSAEYVCFTVTFTAGEGSISLRGQDETVDPPYQAVYDFTAPDGALDMRIRFYRLNNGALDLRRTAAYTCNTADGALTIDYEDPITLDVSYSDGTGSGVDGMSIDDIAMPENQGWRVQLMPGIEQSIIAGQEVPIMMFSSGSTGVNWDAWYSPTNYAGSDVSCVLVTVSFERPTGLIENTTDGITGMDGANFEFSAPANADSLCVRLYTLSGGSWEQLDSFERQFQSSTSGALESSVDGETGTLSYGVKMHEDVEFVPMEHELGISERGWLGAYLADTYFPAVNEEVALVMFSDAAKSGDQPGVEAFARPQDITDDGHTYYCLTMTFLSSETETDPFWTASPQPTTQQEVQSAELVGFTSAFDAGDSYEDIASAWVHDYASNLVLGLPNDDPAACSGVSIGEYSVVAASLTQPERIIVNVSLECEPRDRDAFQEFYGDIVYGLPLAGQSGEPGTGACDMILHRYVTLQLDGTSAACIAAVTDMPALWGWQSFAEQDDWDSYIVSLSADPAITAEELVASVNYTQMEQLGYDGWMACLEALDAAAIAPDGTNDQLVRDMYVLLAAAHADGAYAEQLSDIITRQRGQDPETFALALSACENMQLNIDISQITG